MSCADAANLMFLGKSPLQLGLLRLMLTASFPRTSLKGSRLRVFSQMHRVACAKHGAVSSSEGNVATAAARCRVQASIPCSCYSRQPDVPPT